MWYEKKKEDERHCKINKNKTKHNKRTIIIQQGDNSTHYKYDMIQYDYNIKVIKNAKDDRD